MQPTVYFIGRTASFPSEEHLEALCAACDLRGLFPPDESGADTPPEPLAFRARSILRIEAADAVVAHISLFPQIPMAPVLAWEIGYAQAREKPIFLWCSDTVEDRTAFAPESLMVITGHAAIYPELANAIEAAADGLIHWRARRVGLGLGRKILVAAAIALAAGFLANNFIWK